MSVLADGLGLYVHWPWCARICPYCDFNVYKAAHGDPDAMLGAILADMKHWRERTGARPLASVHFGGGTPSLMTPHAVEAILDLAANLWGFESGAEIGLEANPNEAGAFKALAGAGIERLSLGVQALDDASLAALGRDHSAADALAAADTAQTHFRRVSIDLIYARENQTLTDWERELSRAAALGTGHLSLYQLTIEPGTAFEKRLRRGALDAPDEDLAAAMFTLTQEMTHAAGYAAYEISNHARTPADRSAHNQLYWLGADWIGTGPGAHSRLGRADRAGRLAGEAARRPADYIARAASGRAHALETLPAGDEAVERILTGMRLVEDGLDTERLFAMTGVRPDPDGEAKMIAAGLIRRDGARLILTAEGRVFADGAAAALAPDV